MTTPDQMLSNLPATQTSSSSLEDALQHLTDPSLQQQQQLDPPGMQQLHPELQPALPLSVQEMSGNQPPPSLGGQQFHNKQAAMLSANSRRDTATSLHVESLAGHLDMGHQGDVCAYLEARGQLGGHLEVRGQVPGRAASQLEARPRQLEPRDVSSHGGQSQFVLRGLAQSGDSAAQQPINSSSHCPSSSQDGGGVISLLRAQSEAATAGGSKDQPNKSQQQVVIRGGGGQQLILRDGQQSAVRGGQLLVPKGGSHLVKREPALGASMAYQQSVIREPGGNKVT